MINIDSYQKFANDMFDPYIDDIFKNVKYEDYDEVKITFALAIVGLINTDNFRIYPLKEESQFYAQAEKGCCGSFNSQVKCKSGNIYWIGCNYGH
jgi:hypothetical protein